MRRPGPAAIAIVGVVVAGVIVGSVFLLGGLGPGRGSAPGAFSYTEDLPTGTNVSNGQPDCGSNVTLSLPVPEGMAIYFDMTVNTSGGSANVWDYGTGTYGFAAVSYGGVVQTEVSLGLTGGTLEFFFQGCGSTPFVVLGLWGHYASNPQI